MKLITILWTVFLSLAVILILVAIIVTREFSYLDTFIQEISKTFRAAVVSILITRTVGNIFQFNNGSIFGESIREEDTDELCE